MSSRERDSVSPQWYHCWGGFPGILGDPINHFCFVNNKEEDVPFSDSTLHLRNNELSLSLSFPSYPFFFFPSARGSFPVLLSLERFFSVVPLFHLSIRAVGGTHSSRGNRQPWEQGAGSLWIPSPNPVPILFTVFGLALFWPQGFSQP